MLNLFYFLMISSMMAIAQSVSACPSKYIGVGHMNPTLQGGVNFVRQFNNSYACWYESIMLQAFITNQSCPYVVLDAGSTSPTTNDPCGLSYQHGSSVSCTKNSSWVYLSTIKRTGFWRGFSGNITALDVTITPGNTRWSSCIQASFNTCGTTNPGAVLWCCKQVAWA